MKSKRKVVSLALVVALIAILVAGGSLAYFTDKADATNTFTFGKVDVSLEEYGEGTDPFVDDQKIYPAVDDTTGFEDPNFVWKQPVVTVETDSESAYVRVFISMDVKFADMIVPEFNEDNWTFDGYAVDENGILTIQATYPTAVAANGNTEPAMFGFNVKSAVDSVDGNLSYLSANFGETITCSADQTKIYVNAYAVQSAGFEDEDADSALEAAGFELADMVAWPA